MVTVLIAARNAESTIARAVRSAVAVGAGRILLVDDFSEDDTVNEAYQAASNSAPLRADRLRVIQPSRHQSLGLTRQTGLMAVDTPFTMLLDADDELLPGRIERMLCGLAANGADIFADSLNLHDGATGKFRKTASIPDFLLKHNVPHRLFERNYLPGIGQIGFRTVIGQAVGYDTSLHGPEDTDFVLRMLLGGARFVYDNTPGYRMFTYPASVSRNLDNQRTMYARCLRKFDYATIRKLYLQNGEDQRIALWGSVFMATYRDEPEAALQFLDQIEALGLPDQHTIWEPDGPSPFPEAWRLAFHRGTLLLRSGRLAEGANQLEHAQKLRPTAEGANNLGVVYACLGRGQQAQVLFREALAQFPGFLDPGENLAVLQKNLGTTKRETADTPKITGPANVGLLRVTTQPLRIHASRDEYTTSPPGKGDTET